MFLFLPENSLNDPHHHWFLHSSVPYPVFYKQTTKSRYVHSGIASVSDPTNKGFAVSSLTALSGAEGHYRSNKGS